jgi:hypothetical protein
MYFWVDEGGNRVIYIFTSDRVLTNHKEKEDKLKSKKADK